MDNRLLVRKRLFERSTHGCYNDNGVGVFTTYIHPYDPKTIRTYCSVSKLTRNYHKLVQRISYTYKEVWIIESPEHHEGPWLTRLFLTEVGFCYELRRVSPWLKLLSTLGWYDEGQR